MSDVLLFLLWAWSLAGLIFYGPMDESKSYVTWSRGQRVVAHCACGPLVWCISGLILFCVYVVEPLCRLIWSYAGKIGPRKDNGYEYKS